ncbi:MAG TPA: Uma2 family endonuclease [Phnomibacter sp.]|nr:Uma2 family endonuclease [Phnomibacter sp.]
MGATIKILPHYTYEDYCKWEGQWELIEGIPHAMSPAPIPKHQLIASNVNIEFGIALKKAECKKCKASQPVDYKISEDTIVQPDFLIYCGKTKKTLLDFPPVLIVEILSPSTALKDRHTKFYLYQQAGVHYFLLINPETEIIQVFILDKEEYHLAQEGHSFLFSFQIDDGCRIEVDFGEIW